jgi:hypothetical protein
MGFIIRTNRELAVFWYKDTVVSEEAVASTLTLEASDSCRTLTPFLETSRHHIPEHSNVYTRDLKFPLRLLWRTLSSGICRHVLWQNITNICLLP